MGRKGLETNSVSSAEAELILIEVQQPKSLKTIMNIKSKFRKEYLVPLLDAGLLEMTILDEPNSSKQEYRITEKGKRILKLAVN